MSEMMTDNGANLIIDALLVRMNKLDRFSDDERVIAERELLPLDVVADDEGKFGFVFEAMEYGYDEHGNKRWSVSSAGGVGMIVHDYKGKTVRTIYETEGAAAREYLAKQFGDKKWY